MSLRICWENKSGMLLFPTIVYLSSQNLLSRSWFSGFLMWFPLVYTQREAWVAKINWKIRIIFGVFTSVTSSNCSCANPSPWSTEGKLLQLPRGRPRLGLWHRSQLKAPPALGLRFHLDKLKSEFVHLTDLQTSDWSSLVFVYLYVAIPNRAAQREYQFQGWSEGKLKAWANWQNKNVQKVIQKCLYTFYIRVK